MFLCVSCARQCAALGRSCRCLSICMHTKRDNERGGDRGGEGKEKIRGRKGWARGEGGRGGEREGPGGAGARER